MMPQQRAFLAEDGPQLLLGGDLSNHRKQPGRERTPQLLLGVPDFCLRILVEALKTQLRPLELVLQHATAPLHSSPPLKPSGVSLDVVFSGLVLLGPTLPSAPAVPVSMTARLSFI